MLEEKKIELIFYGAMYGVKRGGGGKKRSRK